MIAFSGKEVELARKNGTRSPKDHRKNKKADFHNTELESLSIGYLESVMNSETVFKQARERISGIGTPDLHLIEIRDFKIPLCSIEEQMQIVCVVNKLFAFADKLEAAYTKAKATLDKLPQSILANAFRGELVVQNREDEPASVLLKKIKAACF